MMGNLLVIDFDYFFRNPLEAGDMSDETFMLYDWGHNEGSYLYLHAMWPSRAASFLANDLPLPYAEIPEGWWDRFNISSEAVCEVSDSNMYSGIVNGCETYDHVWLYDAHHDLYRMNTVEQVDDWWEEGKVTCEDWMFAHYKRGSKLHWRWPRWHKLWKGSDVPKFVGCDARKDDMGKLDPRMEFDAVSICRSGAWVPAWCDEQFIEFVESCPVGEIVEVQDGAMEPRDWVEATQLTLAARKKHDENFRLLREAAGE